MQASFTEIAVAEEFHVSHVVTILSISLFVEGLGVGPLIVGPLSEVYGRNIVYRVSYTLFFAFSWPVAFAPNIGVFFCAFRGYSDNAVGSFSRLLNLPVRYGSLRLCLAQRRWR